MTPSDIILIVLIVAIIGGAVAYIYKAKKRGQKCIGCPHSRECSGCSTGESCQCVDDK